MQRERERERTREREREMKGLPVLCTVCMLDRFDS